MQAFLTNILVRKFSVNGKFLQILHYKHLQIYKHRSRHSEVICKNGVLKNFIKFTGNHLCQSLFFNKVSG